MDADWTTMLCDVARTQQDLRGQWLPNGLLRVSDLRAQSARSTMLSTVQEHQEQTQETGNLSMPDLSQPNQHEI